MTGLAIAVRRSRGFSGIRTKWIQRVVLRTLLFEKKKSGSLSVLVTNDRQIRGLNRRFLRHDYATDVISFGVGANFRHKNPAEAGHIGDLAVSYETAKAFSRKLKIPYREELARYLIHGTLHLLGYDDKTANEKTKMHKRQEQILKQVT